MFVYSGMTTGMVSDAYELIRGMGRIKDDDDQSSVAGTNDEDSDGDNASQKRQHTVKNLIKANKKKKVSL